MTSAPAEPTSWFKKYKRIIISLIGVSLIPLLYAGALVWVNHDPTGNLDKVPAAIVNLDSPATTSNGDTLDLGPDIVEEVLSNDDKSNLDWSEMSSSKATKALKNGDVEAVMTIPEDFSEAAASAGDDDPSKARATRIDIRTNDASNYLMGTISKTVGQTVTDSIREQVTDTYLKNIYVGFTDIHSNIQEAADGSSKLSENTSTAHDASGDLVVGLTKLTDGSVQLDSGAGQLATASGKLDTGAATLADGLGQLKDKADALPGSTKKLADGAATLADGIGSVDSAVTKLNSGAGELHEATGTMSDSAAALPGATKQLATGARKVADGNDQLATTASAVNTQVTSITAGVDETLDAVGDLLDATDGLSSTTTIDVAGTAGKAKSNADALLANDRMQEFLNQPGNEDLKARLSNLKSNTDAVADGTAKTRDAIKRAEQAAGIVDNKPGASVDELKAATAKVRTTSKQLQDSTAQLSDGADQVADGTSKLAEQAPALASGAKQLDSATGRLADGTSQLHSNLPKLKDGSIALADGTSQLHDSVPALVGAVGQLADGADTLHGGTGELKTATAKLAGATSDLVDGTKSAGDGSAELEDGLGQLADGAKELNDGLADGVDQIPNYSDSEQEHLAKINATPVSSDNARDNSMGNYGTGLSPYFMSLALWIGGIGFFMLMAPLSQRLLNTRLPSPVVALRSVWAPAIMAVVQAALVMVMVHFVIGIEMAHPVEVWALAMFASLTFLIVNQGLIAILGAPGRFISLVLVVLQVASAGGTYPVQTMPDFLQGLRVLLPMTYTTQAFRSLIAGGPANGVGMCLLVLSIWLVLGLAFIALAVFLARRSETVRDWATLAPGRPNGGRPASEIEPAVIPASQDSMPDDAGQDRDLVTVGAGSGAAGAGSAAGSGSAAVGAAAAAPTVGGRHAAPAEQATLADEILSEREWESDETEPAPEDAVTAEAEEAADDESPDEASDTVQAEEAGPEQDTDTDTERP
ncbi:MAG: YhgE/Pip family protein [Galactobacter sp.]